MLHHIHLFASLNDLLLVVRVRDTLNCGQCLAATSLLDPDVDKTVLKTPVVPLISIEKWVWERELASRSDESTSTHRSWSSSGFRRQTCDH